MTPPPRSQVPRVVPKRSPRTRPANGTAETEQINQARGFARIAMAAGLGDDIGALTSALPKARWDLKGVALRTFLVGLAVMVSVVIVGLFQQRSTTAVTLPVAASTEAAADEATQDASPLTTELEQREASDTASSVVVHISGAVAEPGLVELEGGSRVNDAVIAAGGFTAQADDSRINLAQPLQDGSHVHIPAQGEAGVPESSGVIAGQPESENGDQLINLNTASAGELESIPGVGPVTAAAILEWREEHGRFAQAEQLLEINGIGEKTFERIRPYVTV